MAKLRARWAGRKAVARRCAVELIAHSATAAGLAPEIAAGSSTAAWVSNPLLFGQDNSGWPGSQHHFPASLLAPARMPIATGLDLHPLMPAEPWRSRPWRPSVGPPNARALRCGGLSHVTLAMAALQYLMLGAQPNDSSVRPRQLQRVVRLRFPVLPKGGTDGRPHMGRSHAAA